MANEIKLKKWNADDDEWVQQYPEVRHTDIVASGTRSATTFLNGNGEWAVPSGSGDGNTKFYAWRAIENTSSGGAGYYRIANINGQASTRFHIEITGRSQGYSDTNLPNYAKILGQYNNDNNYDVWVFNNKTGTSEVVIEVGTVDDGTNNVDIWVKVSSFAEVTATAYISDGTITTYDSNSETSTEPTGYSAVTEYIMWNSGNDGNGSGLDADTLDTKHASDFVAVTGDTMTGHLKFNGDRSIAIGSNNSNSAVSGDPDAQLVLDGLHNNGYNLSTKLLIRGYDNESARSVIKTIDENGSTDFHITANPTNPLMYFRGTLGIATTTIDTAYKLQVNGNAHLGNIDVGAGTFKNRINASGDNSLVINSNGGVLSLNADNSNNVLLVAGGGRVGIGTTSPASDYKLDVNGKIRTNNNIIAGNFVDYNNSNYYLNPSASSNINNLTIAGNLTVNGTTTTLDTTVSTTDQWTVTNAGTDIATIINQTGTADILDVRDNGTSVFKIKDGGNVEMKTDTKLTIGASTTANEAKIILDSSNGGHPQISLAENNDASWGIGVDDTDNSFKIHGSASSTIPTIAGLTTPHFELDTTGNMWLQKRLYLTSNAFIEYNSTNDSIDFFFN